MPDVVAVVLAAGLSTRFGEANKLLAVLDDEALICKTVRSATEAGLSVVVVTGYEADSIEEALEAWPQVRFARNPRFPEGLGTSIACGVSESSDAAGWIIVPGDMPRVTASTLRKLAAKGLEGGTNGLAACRLEDTLSPPCFFGSRFLKVLAGLSGDKGARAILAANENRVAVLEVDTRELEDIDLPMSEK